MHLPPSLQDLIALYVFLGKESEGFLVLQAPTITALLKFPSQINDLSICWWFAYFAHRYFEVIETKCACV